MLELMVLTHMQHMHQKMETNRDNRKIFLNVNQDVRRSNTLA